MRFQFAARYRGTSAPRWTPPYKYSAAPLAAKNHRVYATGLPDARAPFASINVYAAMTAALPSANARALRNADGSAERTMAKLRIPAQMNTTPAVCANDRTSPNAAAPAIATITGPPPRMIG